MPKKTTILIIILFLFTVGLVYIAIQTEQQRPPEVDEEPISEDEALSLIPTIEPRTDITFSPQTINTVENPQQSYSIDTMVNTNGQNISGVQLELSYDPEILNNVTVTTAQNNLFGENPTVIVNEVDEELGRISYVISLSPNDEEISGSGNIANITFSTGFTTEESTQISITPKTIVKTLKSNNSLLRNIEPITIEFIAPTPTDTADFPTSTLPPDPPLDN